MQVPDWHPGTPASNQEIFNQDTWQVNMENFFSELVTTYPGVVGKLILDLVNVCHSSSSSSHVSCLIPLLYVLVTVSLVCCSSTVSSLSRQHQALLILSGCNLRFLKAHRPFFIPEGGCSLCTINTCVLSPFVPRC